MKVRAIAWTTGLILVAACRQRTVEVRTAPQTAQQQPQVAVQIDNKLSQAVNVYVVANGSQTFLRQVAAGATQTVPVQGFAPGASVGLIAVTLDGSRTYKRDNVVLNGTYLFPLP